MLALNKVNIGVALNPRAAVGYFLRGVIYSKTNSSLQALAEYNNAILVSPWYSEAYNNIGNIYYESEHYEKAIKYYNKAAELKNWDAAPYRNLAITYLLALDNRSMAISNFTLAAKQGDITSQNWLTLEGIFFW